MLRDILLLTYVQFSFQLLVSEVIFLFGRQRRNNFPVRALIAVILQFVMSYVWMNLNAFLFAEFVLENVTQYIGYAVISCLAILLCFDVSALETVFIVAGGYASEHIIFAINCMIKYLIFRNTQTENESMIQLLVLRYLIYIVGAAVIYILIVRSNESKVGFSKGDLRIAVLAMVLTITAIGLSSYWSYSVAYSETLLVGVICPVYSALCCMLVLFMEYDVLRENNLKHEREVMEQLLQMADAQQKSSKEAIDIINIKCHDLKHQIKSLAKMEDAKSRSEYLEEVQNAVSIYDATYQTGCKALDYVLREKSLIFDEYGVEFSCMADGGLIDFISVTDIYALMGNALDNALESVLKERDGEKVISLQIRCQGDMVLVHLENRCSKEPIFRDGLPVTSKKDKNMHGFGVKSIQYIVEKYKGELYMSASNGRFYLDILFQIQK